MAQKHALVIDDDAFSLEVLERLLGAEGVSCTTVQDPTNVSAIIEEVGHFDVIFLDFEMPKMDGYRLFEVLRARFGVGVPIVACTVHTSEIDVAHNLGFHSFIGKPIEAEHFPGQLTKILHNEPVWGD